MRSSLVTIITLAIITAAQTGAEARRENPFIPQLPVPVTAKPVDPEAAVQPVVPTQTEITEPVPKPRIAEPTRVFLPPPPEPEVKRQPVAVRPPNLIIKGIIWNSDKPQAIINDTIINVGDKVSNAVIKDIQKNLIIYEYQGTEFRTQL